MPADLSPIDKAKHAAAVAAVALVEDGMRLGLGTGSTAAWMVRSLAERVAAARLRVTCVPTSERTADLARQLGLTLATLDDLGWLDMTIDGADEFDADFQLIKGGGGALLREKIVAAASDRMVVIADAAKQVAQLGAFPLPVEVIPFGLAGTRTLIGDTLATLGHDEPEITLRMQGEAPFRTDQGNWILDLRLGRIAQPRQLALLLNQVPGVVENGLFIDICDTVVIGHADGTAEIRDIDLDCVAASAERGGADNIFADS